MSKFHNGEGVISVGGDADLQGTAAIHLVECLLEIVKLVFIGHHSLRLDFATIEVRNGTREAVRLRERTDDLDLVTEDL